MTRRPTFVLVTASGAVDAASALERDALVVTTAAGRERLAGRLSAVVRVMAWEGDRLALARALPMLRAEGLHRILSEGGPSLIGQLIAEGALDKLFLTRSPLLLGRQEGDGRKTLVGGSRPRQKTNFARAAHSAPSRLVPVPALFTLGA